MLGYKHFEVKPFFLYRTKKKVVLLWLLLFSITQITAQSIELPLKEFLENVRSGMAVSEYDYLLESDNLELLNELAAYTNVDHPSVRYAAQRLNLAIARKNPDNVEIRQIVIERLIDDCYAFDSAIWKRAIKRLNNLIHKDDLDLEKQKKISALLKDNSKLCKELIFLIGNADLHNEKPFLIDLIKNQPINPKDKYWHNSPAWASCLVLAKFGEEEFTTYCISRIRSEANYSIISHPLFKHLAYIRNQASINLLAEYVFSDIVVEGHGEHILGFQLAYDASMRLFSLIEYPKELSDDDGFIELAQARAWLKKQKTLKIKE